MCYDAAGNVIFDNQLGAAGDRTYDAENRMVTAAGGGANSYGYNADGKRVRRAVGAQTFWQVYGVGGELVAEYLWNGATATLQKEHGYRDGEMLIVAEGATVRWLVKDHLGAPRILADQTGSLAGIRRHDYLPFGEETLAGAQRSGNGYQAEGVRQKFTGYERDAETGLDFAQARYYSNLTGRFASVDPLDASSEISDPQTWNRYSYVGNHPTAITDPSGMIWAYNASANKVGWFPGVGLSQEQVAEGWREIAVGAFGATYVSENGDLIWLNPNRGEWRNLGYVGPRIDFQHGLGSDIAIWYMKFAVSNVAGGFAFKAVGASFAAARIYMASRAAAAAGSEAAGAIGSAAEGVATNVADDILVLGRGPVERLQRLADLEGGRLSNSNSSIAKEIFKRNYSDMRSANRIVQYMDDIPESLPSVIERQYSGQFSRAELFMIKTRPDLAAKTLQKFEKTIVP